MSVHRRSPGAVGNHLLITLPGRAVIVLPFTQAMHGPKILRIIRMSREVYGHP